jgi:hypothetical protein
MQPPSDRWHQRSSDSFPEHDDANRALEIEWQAQLPLLTPDIVVSTGMSITPLDSGQVNCREDSSHLCDRQSYCSPYTKGDKVQLRVSTFKPKYLYRSTPRRRKGRVLLAMSLLIHPLGVVNWPPGRM